MGTPRLLWGMTIRGGGWTLPVGALCAAIYSAVVIGSMFLIARLSGTGSSQPAPPVAMLATMLLILGIGGAIVGGLIGLVLGPIGGLLCGIMTRFFFFPSPEPRRYLRAVRWTGALYGAVATPIGLWVISGFNVPPPTGQAGNALLFYVLPTLVGAAAGFFIGRQIAEWYEKEKTDESLQARASIPSAKAVTSQ